MKWSECWGRSKKLNGTSPLIARGDNGRCDTGKEIRIMNCEVKHQLYSTGFVRDVQSESHPQHSTGYTLATLITSKRSIIGFCSSLDHASVQYRHDSRSESVRSPRHLQHGAIRCRQPLFSSDGPRTGRWDQMSCLVLLGSFGMRRNSMRSWDRS